MIDAKRLQFLTVVSLCLVMIGVPGRVGGATPAQIITLRVGDPVMQVDGHAVAIDAQGTAPVIVENRTLLPVRSIVEALGGTVAWDPDRKLVSITVDVTHIQLVIGKAGATVNGIPVAIDTDNPRVAPRIINGRTMVPVRFVGERLGAAVTWVPDTKVVTLAFGTRLPAPPATPLLIAPADGAASTDAEPVLIWSPVEGADTYRVTIARGKDIVLDEGGIAQSPWAVPRGVLTPGTYTWKVTAVGKGGTGAPQAQPFTFTVKAPILQPLAQTVEMHVTYAGWVPSILHVKAGAQVTWVIWGDQVTGCTDRIVVPALGITQDLSSGKNVVAFRAPSAGTTIAFSCWMNMVKGTIIVDPS